jgi:uncharacterized protein
MVIVDRRANPQGKSLPNRQRFLERARDQVRRAVRDTIARRGVADLDLDEEVKVQVDGTEEPSFRQTGEGDHDFVLPGTGAINRGDRVGKPPSGSGKGAGSGSGGGSGGGEDAFQFVLTREEFLHYFLDELELPRLLRTNLAQTNQSKPKRAGYSIHGQPSALDVRRTMRNSMARRLALKRPNQATIETLKAEIEDAIALADDVRLGNARQALEEALRRSARIPYVDPVDVRYTRHERQPMPATEAVMFCLMDVSGSMTEHMKDLAKRFFMLLHLFLERKYERVHVVFIRHTETAAEVDEETFFRSRETGGTVVSSALDVMLKVQEERFPVDRFNIYVAQASDGDNISSDRATVDQLMRARILPIVRYFAYVETQGGFGDYHPTHRGETMLWSTYSAIAGSSATPNLAMRRLADARDVFGVLAELFAKSAANPF